MKRDNESTSMSHSQMTLLLISKKLTTDNDGINLSEEVPRRLISVVPGFKFSYSPGYYNNNDIVLFSTQRSH